MGNLRAYVADSLKTATGAAPPLGKWYRCLFGTRQTVVIPAPWAKKFTYVVVRCNSNRRSVQPLKRSARAAQVTVCTQV